DELIKSADIVILAIDVKVLTA
ncbi:hypothetical protein GASC598I20_003380, partial [Gilliamella apicola SCGC AB-598-I20]